MSRKFQPKDQFLQHLINDFEESLENKESIFLPEEEFEKLVDYYESIPEYDKALAAVNQAIDLFPYSGALYIKKTQLLIYLKDYPSAWDTIEIATIYEPMSLELTLLEADLYTAEGCFDDAIDRLNQLFSSVDKEEKSDVLLEIADVYEVANNVDQLGHVLKEVLTNFPENEEALHRYWNYIIDYEKHEEGIELFSIIIDARPYNFLAWYYLAKSFEQVSLLEKAQDAYEFCLAINDYYFAYWDYGLCLQQLDKFDQAISTYYEMLRLFDHEDNIYFEIGHCFLQKGDFVKARAAYTNVLNTTKELSAKAQAYFYSANAFEIDDMYSNAIDYMLKAVELKSKKTKYINFLGNLYFKNEEFELAAQTYIQSLAINDSQVKPWLKLAKAYNALQLPDILIEALGRATKLLQKNAKVHYHYAAYLLHYGHTQTGLFALERALTLDSTKKNSIFALFAELESNNEVLELINQFEN